MSDSNIVSCFHIGNVLLIYCTLYYIVEEENTFYYTRLTGSSIVVLFYNFDSNVFIFTNCFLQHSKSSSKVYLKARNKLLSREALLAGALKL